MKLNRTYFIFAISSIALTIVLIIQVNWIYETARVKEELFNERVNLVLTKTAEALSSDKETLRNLHILVGKDEVHKIDSLLNHYMNFYNILIKYSFELQTKPVAEIDLTQYVYKDPQGSFAACLSESELNEKPNSSERLELKLFFPKKEKYILAEMGMMFITSVILILVVLVISWRTILSLLNEKKISKHTRDFLNNMTHEFKTPLTNISLAGKMITKDSNIGQPERIKHYSGIILDENEKLQHEVEQVLNMAALEKGEIPLQKTNFDLHKLIQDILKSLSPQIEYKKASISLDLNALEYKINGDQIHLSNAICNLIDNSLKYSKLEPRIKISTHNKDENIVIKISDEGIGIEKEHQQKVFEKFFRVPTDDLHESKGFGIGLAYVKRIIELHGGTIRLNSEKGHGSTFKITLTYV